MLATGTLFFIPASAVQQLVDGSPRTPVLTGFDGRAGKRRLIATIAVARILLTVVQVRQILTCTTPVHIMYRRFLQLMRLAEFVHPFYWSPLACLAILGPLSVVVS